MEAIVQFAQSTGFYQLFGNIAQNWTSIVMILVSLLLLYLAIVKGFEPLLLVGIAFGMLLTNLPGAGMYHSELWDASSPVRSAMVRSCMTADCLTFSTSASRPVCIPA